MTRYLLIALLTLASAPAAEPVHLGKSLGGWSGDLRSADRVTRLLAARSVGEMAIAGADGALEVLKGALDSKDSAVRYWAAVALGEMGPRASKAAGALRDTLRDAAPEVRVWAAYALVRQGDRDAGVPALIETLGSEERGARLQAVTALDQLGEAGRPAVPQLRKAVGDDFDYVGRIARHALWVLGERPCPYRDCD